MVQDKSLEAEAKLEQVPGQPKLRRKILSWGI